MKLAFVCHVMFYKQDGKYLCTPGFCRMVEVAAPLCDVLHLCVPVTEEAPPENMGVLDVPNVKICPLPPYYNYIELEALKHPISLMRSLWPYIQKSDAVWINLPNWLCIFAWLVCLLQQKRFALTIVGNWPELLRLGFRRRNMPIFGEIVGGAHELLIHLMISTSNTAMVNSTVLLKTFGRGKARVGFFIDSSIEKSNISNTIAGSNSEERRLLFVGRLLRDKGTYELFAAARDLLAEGIPLRVSIAGDGVRQDEITQFAKEIGVYDRIDFLGWVDFDQLSSVYRSADVLVMPSYSEGMPKVILEAMSNGLPVVATDVGGVSYVVQDGQTGYLVPPKNADAIRDAVRKLLKDEPLRKQMALAGLARSHEFTMSAERDCLGKAFRKYGVLPADIDHDHSR